MTAEDIRKSKDNWSYRINELYRNDPERQAIESRTAGMEAQFEIAAQLAELNATLKAVTTMAKGDDSINVQMWPMTTLQVEM